MGLALHEFAHHFLLEIAKGRFALALEERADGTADPTLDLVIGVDEGHIQGVCKMTAGGGFAGAWHGDQADRACQRLCRRLCG